MEPAQSNRSGAKAKPAVPQDVSWRGAAPRERVVIGPVAGLRAVLRGSILLAVLLVCFPLLLLLRLPERAIWGQRRPLTPWITQGVCVFACFVLSLHRRQDGKPATGGGVVLANHVSWLDIFVLNASTRGSFVAKSEVRGWPGIGWLARGTGTIFVERKRAAAKVQQTALANALAAGHWLIIFPEGTSTDGLRVLPFKSTVLAALYAPGMPEDLMVQPVSLRYHAPRGRDARFYGWWAGFGFARSLFEVLAQGPQGSVDIIWHTPIACAGEDRKSLAAKAGAVVRAGVEG